MKVQVGWFIAWSMSNHEPENGAEYCDHCTRGETPHSSFILDCAMHTTCGMGESVVASTILNQTALYLAQYEAKRCTITVIYIEFACSSPAGGMLFGVSGLLLLLLLSHLYY